MLGRGVVMGRVRVSLGLAVVLAGFGVAAPAFAAKVDSTPPTVPTAGRVQAAADLSIDVEVTNDADGDGSYHGTEMPSGARPVPVRAVLTNASTVAVRITSLASAVGAGAGSPVCASLIGTALQPGASVLCRFTLPAVSPPAGGGIDIRVDFGGTQVGLDSNVVSEIGTSTVGVDAAEPDTPEPDDAPSAVPPAAPPAVGTPAPAGGGPAPAAGGALPATGRAAPTVGGSFPGPGGPAPAVSGSGQPAGTAAAAGTNPANATLPVVSVPAGVSPAASDSLPRTGTSTSAMLLVGMLLLGAGMVLLGSGLLPAPRVQPARL